MKQILITGATSGIGYSAAKSFQQLGHQVIITGRRPEKLDQALHSLNTTHTGNPVQGLICDQAVPADIEQLSATLTAQGIHLDALILNAGIFEPQPFDTMTLDVLEHTMRVNFTGPLLLAQTLSQRMKNPGSMVFVSSIVVGKAFASTIAYSASKAAFEGAMGAMNVELADKGIRVNCVRPGVTATEIQAKSGMDNDAIAGLQQAMSQTPAGRMLEPRDIVPAIKYLALESSLGARNATVTIDGGYCL
tara:strand:+ start:13833 stop:14576 length:744 start_codon:yes stop_codon:yes gene_type:complete